MSPSACSDQRAELRVFKWKTQLRKVDCLKSQEAVSVNGDVSMCVFVCMYLVDRIVLIIPKLSRDKVVSSSLLTAFVPVSWQRLIVFEFEFE